VLFAKTYPKRNKIQKQKEKKKKSEANMNSGIISAMRKGGGG